ncbi:MAG TPA: hypothetical protein VIY48_13075 [Candidatus Paceibacterota bacterium]
MPFNGSGTFTIVNTFVPNTTILSAAVNQNFSDIATGLSDCLTRDGQAGMTAAFKAISGALASPSITFTADATSGLFLSSTGIIGFISHSLGMLLNTEVFAASSATVAAGGSGYAVGDTITETGGTAIVQPVFTVATLSGSAVATVTVAHPGFYITKPGNPVAQGSSSGAGTGCTLNITYNDPTSSDYRAVFTDQANGLLWQKFGASSFVSGLMSKANGFDFATAIGASNIAAVLGASFLIPPGGVLTPMSSTTVPIVPSDQIGVTRIFWTPLGGGGLPIYNGTVFVNTVPGQMTCDLIAGSQVLNGIYDVYAFLNSGSPNLGLSPSWSAGTSGSVAAGSCARGTGVGGTALSILSGIYVNTVSMTVNNGASTFTIAANQGTYLGSVYISTTAGQYSCILSAGQSRTWGLWNCYNRSNITVQAQDPTASWTTAPTTWRQSRGDATNFIMTFQGLATERVDLNFTQSISQAFSSSTSQANIGIGLNSTTVPSGKIGFASIGNNSTVGSGVMDAKAAYVFAPFIGINKFNMIEQAPTGTTNNNFEGSSDMLMTASWRA